MVFLATPSFFLRSGQCSYIKHSHNEILVPKVLRQTLALVQDEGLRLVLPHAHVPEGPEGEPAALAPGRPGGEQDPVRVRAGPARVDPGRGHLLGLGGAPVEGRVVHQGLLHEFENNLTGLYNPVLAYRQKEILILGKDSL